MTKANFTLKKTFYYLSTMVLIGLLTPFLGVAQTFTGAGNPQALPPAGTGGFPCVGGPTSSIAASTLVGTIGTDFEIVAVNMDITHTFDSDVEAELVSPDGTILDLTSDNGGAGDNYTATVFQDGGADVTAGVAPFTGTFEPEGGTFAATFVGDAVFGDWTLSICDDAGGDSGTLNSFSIEFAATGPPPLMGQTCGTGTAALPIDIPDAAFDGSLGSMGSFSTAVAGVPIQAAIQNITAYVPFDHTWVGDITIVLEAPDGRLLPLMSHPGVTGAGFGDSSDADVVAAGAPLNWSDGGATDAEDMGSTIAGGDVVGQDDGFFSYFPNGDGITITGGGAQVAAFSDLYDLSDAANGTWTVHIGDNAGGDTGRIRGLEVCIDYVTAGLALEDPCDCLDNATRIDPINGTGGTDGQFDETVTTIGNLNNPGRFFRVTLITGAWDLSNIPPVGTQSLGLPLSVGDDMVYNAVSGEYELNFVHVDNIGYRLRVREHDGLGNFFGAEYEIGNKCAYPNPVFVPVLDDVYCNFQNPITFGGTAAGGADAITFTVDGAVETTFDPGAYIPGSLHEIVMIYDGADDGNGGISPDGGITAAFPGCTQEVGAEVSVEPINIGCIGTLNVTLDASLAACNATITPQMVLTGNYACVDDFNVLIGGVPTDKIVGCGTHEYMIQAIVDGNVVHTCWGDVVAEDKDAPVVVCPLPTNQGRVAVTSQTISGNLDGTELNPLVLNDYSCFSDFFQPQPGAHNYDLVTFTPSDTDVYTFLVTSAWTDANFTLYQGAFDPTNPCQNVIGHNEDIFSTGPAFQFDPALRLSLPLRAGASYTLMISNWSPFGLGTWDLEIVSDGDSFVENITSEGVAYTAAPVSTFVNIDLICDDLNLIQIIGQEQYVVNADGSNPGVFAGGMTPALRAKLRITGQIPSIRDNCGQILVTVSDQVSAPGDCGDITLTRTFSAADRYNSTCTGDPLVTACTQVIIFRRPSIDDVILPAFNAPIECDEDFAVDANGNPHPSVSGYPWIMTAAGFIDLADDYCNVGASYSDEPRIDVCTGTYKFRREWNIIDWCNIAGNNLIYDQIVKVGNFTGPVISHVISNNNGGLDIDFEISTSPFGCTANWPVPYADTDTNCGADADNYWNRYVTILDSNGDYVWSGREHTTPAQTTQTVVTSLEIGVYTATWCISDDCGTETCTTWNLIVTDRIAPTASCNDELNVSIGGGDTHNGIEGIARIYAADVDQASYDNCEIDRILIRRNYFDRGPDLIHYTPDDTCHPSANRWSNWNDYINFFCCDLGNEITIEMRVYDTAGNFNTCWFVVTPEDKLIPYCYPPAPVNIDCNDLPEYYPGDIELAWNEDEAGTHAMLDALFGEAWGTDNCKVDSVVERRPSFNVNDCGWGQITRRFEIWQEKIEGDANGNGRFDRSEAWVSINTCAQPISINEIHEYRIEFPQDASADCQDACVWDIITETTGCDILAVNTAPPVRFTATGDECYKESITYDVINWCIWDGEYVGYTIPRRTETDNSFALDRAVESAERPILTGGTYVGPPAVDGGVRTSGVFVDRDHDNRYPGNVLNPGNDLRRADCPTDTNGNPTAVPTSPLRSWDNSRLGESHSWPQSAEFPGVDLQGLFDADGSGPGGHYGHEYVADLNRGRWNYTQFIKVYDTTVPEVTVDAFGGPTAECPDLVAGQFGDPYGACEANVNVPFSVDDDCDLFNDNRTIRYVSIVSAELDMFVTDVNQDGLIKANEFSADQNVLVTSNPNVNGLLDSGDSTFVYTARLPIITKAMGADVYHALKVVFVDGCGNVTNEIIRIDVIDCKGPAPICINGLTVTLMPVEPNADGTQPDVDGDGDADDCAMAIWASDFEGSPIFDCTGQGPETNGNTLRVHKYAMYRVDEVADPATFVPDPTHTGSIFTDDDLADELINVYVWAFDQDGNYDYCQTYVQVEAHATCLDGTSSGTLSGTITTEAGDYVGSVEVSVNVNGQAPYVTSSNGQFTFTLPAGGDYTLTPYLNDAPLNGVSTFDLVLMSKHILGVDLLETPYKRIAADVNRSETITTLDMIQIRKLILGVDTEFSNNTSWRFIPAGTQFSDDTNPWAGVGFDELISVNDLPRDVVTSAPFIGIKTGDVSGNALANLLSSDDRTMNGQFNFNVENTDMKVGNIYTVAFTAADIASVKGYQATLALAGAELVDIEYGVATAENFGLRFADQGMITTSWNGEATSDDVLFSLVIRATVDAQLSEVVKVSSRYTAAEAYNNNSMMNVGINFSGVEVANAGFELYQNTPNPFQAETMIGFNVPVDGKATITISDISGRVLFVATQDVAAGYNDVTISKEMINNTTGVLSYTVTAGDFSATKSMIVVK